MDNAPIGSDDAAHTIQLLQREYLFHGLDADQLAWVASRFRKVTLDTNTVVYPEEGPADCFYIVLDGKVHVTRKVKGKERLLSVMGEGDFFGEQALLFDRQRRETVTTVEKTTLLRLNKDRFSILINDFPQIRLNLSATAESRRLAQKMQFSWLDPDEVIYYLNRKHNIFLLTSLIIPILLVIISIPTLVFAYNAETTPFVNTVVWVAGALMLFGGIGLGIWNAVDWGNDYFIVTSRRVIWLEKVVGLYDSRREAPLTRVLSVNVFTSQLGRILKYGDVNVRTYTTGILMERMDKPYEFASFLENYRERAKLISKEEEARDMAQALEQALQARLRSPQVILPSEDAAPPPVAEKIEEPKKKTSSLRENFRTFLKVRYEQGDMITYRKHWWLLFRKTWLPLFGIFGVLVFWGVLTVRGSELISSLLVDMAMVFTFLFSLVALIYQYVDWRNDIYRLTTTQIFDIEKKPLGREMKKTANLDTILSIEHERVNIIGILLNFGTVTVNVGDAQFIFYGVFNPDQVHQDVSDRQEALNRKKIEAENKRERERMVNWLVAYYEETGKIGDFENNPGTIPFSG
jgi:CRP-like cAMP-binding protein